MYFSIAHGAWGKGHGAKSIAHGAKGKEQGAWNIELTVIIILMFSEN